MGLLIYILLSLVIFILISLLRIRFDVDYHRREQDDNLVVRMSLLRGLVRYKTEVPTVELENRFLTPVLKMASEMEQVVDHPVEEKKLQVGIPFTMSFIRRLPRVMRSGWKKFGRYNADIYYLFRFVRCRHFYWRTEIGLSDAANTGIVVGMIWAVKSMLYNNFRSKIGYMSKRPAIQVVPDYCHKKLALDFNCIFDIRIGYIIIAGLKFVRNALRKNLK